MDKIVIGHNPAANMLPMFYHLDKSDPRLEFVFGVPAAHNQLMAAGQLDMAPISAFSFGQHWEQYTVLANLSVSAKGPIGSILLYSKRKLEDLDGRRITLTNTSATSVNLLKVILERFYRVRPDYLTMAPEFKSMLSEADAALLIADEALLGLSQTGNYRIYDLSQEWYNHTGLSMTFAVWAVSNVALERSPALIADVHKLLLDAKDRGLDCLGNVIDYCITTLGYDYEFWSKYFSQLRYGLEPDLLQGLKTYFAYCLEQGLLPSQPQINIKKTC